MSAPAHARRWKIGLADVHGSLGGRINAAEIGTVKIGGVLRLRLRTEGSLWTNLDWIFEMEFANGIRASERVGDSPGLSASCVAPSSSATSKPG